MTKYRQLCQQSRWKESKIHGSANVCMRVGKNNMIAYDIEIHTNSNTWPVMCVLVTGQPSLV